MYHEIILENEDHIKDYYFESKIYKRKEKNSSDFIEYIDNNKNYKKNTNKKLNIKEDSIIEIKKISGIFDTREDMEEYVKELIPGSFGIWHEFKLKSPYFSRDDDELYVIQNPVIKEKTAKVPMIKGSSWKGLLSSAALEKLKKTFESKEIPNIISCYLSFVRIFGTGSEKFRELEKEIRTIINEAERKDARKLTNILFQYCVFDLGIKIDIKKDGTSIGQQLIDQIIKKENRKKVEKIFSVNKGRAIFYPTYFDKVGYEVINPHDRKKRAGTNPIFYEVVPKGSKGIFQLVYIPYDGILLKENELKRELKADKEFIEEILKEALENYGIGAKTKLGWGRAKLLQGGE